MAPSCHWPVWADPAKFGTLQPWHVLGTQQARLAILSSAILSVRCSLKEMSLYFQYDFSFVFCWKTQVSIVYLGFHKRVCRSTPHWGEKSHFIHQLTESFTCSLLTSHSNDTFLLPLSFVLKWVQICRENKGEVLNLCAQMKIQYQAISSLKVYCVGVVHYANHRTSPDSNRTVMIIVW